MLTWWVDLCVRWGVPEKSEKRDCSTVLLFLSMLTKLALKSMVTSFPVCWTQQPVRGSADHGCNLKSLACHGPCISKITAERACTRRTAQRLKMYKNVWYRDMQCSGRALSYLLNDSNICPLPTHNYWPCTVCVCVHVCVHKLLPPQEYKSILFNKALTL